MSHPSSISTFWGRHHRLDEPSCGTQADGNKVAALLGYQYTGSRASHDDLPRYQYSTVTSLWRHQMKVNMNKNISMDIPVTWQFVRKVKRLIEDELDELPDAFRYSASMVAAELVGNAIKYGETSKSAPQAHFNVSVTPSEMVIEVSNSIKSEENLREVQTRIDQLSVSSNRETLYLKRLEELLSGNSQGSQLGLYRIGYEGEFDLSYTYTNHEHVLTIRATRGLS